MISTASFKYAFQIATIHHQSISQGFLSKLGIGFLQSLYGFLIQKELVLVYIENNQILGFVSCAISSKGIMKRFLVSSPGGIVKIGFVLIKSPGLLKSLWETFKAPSMSASDDNSEIKIPATELLSIGVSKNTQQGGIGTQLLIALEEELKKRGIIRYKVLAGEKLEGANKFYNKNGFVMVKKITIHGNDISKVYVKEL